VICCLGHQARFQDLPSEVHFVAHCRRSPTSRTVGPTLAKRVF